MMTFSTREIFSSVVFALAYGSIFAMFFSFILAIKGSLALVWNLLKETVKYNKILPLPSFKGAKISIKSGAALSIIAIFSFAIGFSLLSYMSLDGQLRLYMLILSFASFYLSKNVFCDIFTVAFLLALKVVFILFALVVRVVLLLPKKIYTIVHIIKIK